MVEKAPVVNAYKASTEKLVHALGQVPREIFNSAPQDGGWSVGMVADHLLQLEKRISHFIAAPAKTCDRPPDDKLKHISGALLNTTVKYKSPSFLIPTIEPVSQKVIIEELQQQKSGLLLIAETMDLAELCTDYPHNRLGELTRLEWIWFTIYHTERHLQQVKHIERILATASA